MAHPALLKQKAIDLRLQSNSLLEISQKLNIAKSTASIWLKDIKLTSQILKQIDQKRKDKAFQPGNTQWQKTSRSKHLTKWTPKKLQQLKSLYSSGLSISQVGIKMNCNVWAISSAMKRHSIKRRSSSHTNRIRYYRSPLSFQSKQILTQKEQQLKIAGLMLYWAEGSKKQPHRVDFANSDPLMIKVFTKFLRQIYRVDESRLRCLVYCYPSHNVNKLTHYWSNLVNIPTSQFIRPFIRKDGGNTRDKMEHGLLHVAYSDKRLLQLILKEIKNIGYNI
jgi:hypothetical protein